MLDLAAPGLAKMLLTVRQHPLPAAFAAACWALPSRPRTRAGCPRRCLTRSRSRGCPSVLCPYPAFLLPSAARGGRRLSPFHSSVAQSDVCTCRQGTVACARTRVPGNGRCHKVGDSWAPAARVAVSGSQRLPEDRPLSRPPDFSAPATKLVCL